MGFALGLVAFLLLLSLVAGVLSLAGGVGLLGRRRWARAPLLVASVLQLFSVPVGTALGAYGLWVLLSEEGRRALGRPVEG